MEEKKNRVRKIIYRDSIILLAGILYAVFVRLTGLAVPCIFRTLTGWQCPGCGITRACLSLLKGEIRTSFSYNPFLYGFFFICKDDAGTDKNKCDQTADV